MFVAFDGRTEVAVGFLNCCYSYVVINKINIYLKTTH